MICSMTGFSSRVFSYNGENYKIELKTLNHRFLEMKFRMPKEWSVLEAPIKALLESKLKRGSVDLWIEKATEQKNASAEIRINMQQAEKAMDMLKELQRKLKITDPITIRDVLNFPDVMSKQTAPQLSEESLLELKSVLMEEVSGALEDLVRARAVEGEKIKKAILTVVEQFRNTHLRFLNLRINMQRKANDKVRKKVEQCFESFTTPDAQMRALMETRISQEIALTLDKMDIEEELARYRGHVDEIEHMLSIGGMIGKKLDFMFQELNREINTLGNKAQDLNISHDVIELKTWVEQLREQSLNIE
jgi:uncharacterized protein (TIGR00255 family)